MDQEMDTQTRVANHVDGFCREHGISSAFLQSPQTRQWAGHHEGGAPHVDLSRGCRGMAATDGGLGRRAAVPGEAAMTQQLEMLTNTPPYIDRDRVVQELIKLLVEAELMLPDNEKRHVLDKAIAPLFDALMTLNEVKKVPAEGLIVMSLLGSGYQDYAQRLWPSRTPLSEETAGVGSTSSATGSKLEEAANVA
jgi:hypothetical protein